MAVCSEIHTKHMNTVLNVKRAVHIVTTALLHAVYSRQNTLGRPSVRLHFLLQAMLLWTQHLDRRCDCRRTARRYGDLTLTSCMGCDKSLYRE